VSGYITTEYGEVLNSTETFDALADDLIRDGRIILGWNDEHGSLIDVALTLNAPRVGPGGRIDSRREKLVVAAMGHGAFAFGPGGYLEPGYFCQKMGITAPCATWVKLAELVTEVRTRLTERGALL